MYKGKYVTGSTTIPNTEYYNEERNEWIEVASMNLNRSALAACVIRGLPNAAEYSYKHHIICVPEASKQ